MATRWTPVDCPVCVRTHGFSSGAMIQLVAAGMAGDLVTTLGNAVCPLSVVVDSPQMGTNVNGRRIDATWSVAE